jgi:predicted nucleotidyltransferase
LRPEAIPVKVIANGRMLAGEWQMTRDSAQVFETLESHRQAIRTAGARRLGLFGSWVRGEARETSDLDFLVEFEPGRKTFDGYMDLKLLLEELFGRSVDLVIAEGIKPRLRESILREVVYVPGF